MKNALRIFACSFALATAFAPSIGRADTSITQFQANGLLATQSGGGNSYTGQASWNPEISLGVIDVRGNLGAAVLKSAFDNTFLAINYQVLLKKDLLGPLAIEAGGGLETWLSGGSTHPIVGGNLAWERSGMINRIFAGYSVYMIPNNSTSEIRAGLGFEI